MSADISGDWTRHLADADTSPQPYYQGEGVTLWHGDCLEVMRGMEAGSVDAIITDPPYLNTGTGSSRVSRSAAIPDERQFFDLWMREMWREWARLLRPTGGLWMTIDWRGAVSCERAAGGSPLSFGGVGIWDKENLGMGFMLRKGYECFVVARMPEWARASASVPDVWRIKWNYSSRETEHEAEKPVPLMVRGIETIAPPRGGVVLDPFCGAGTTAIACLETGHRFIGIEREAVYAEIARKRIADASAQLTLGAA